MNILKDTKCKQCGTETIKVVSFTDKDRFGRYISSVSHGECTKCGHRIVLPQESYFTFTRNHCK